MNGRFFTVSGDPNAARDTAYNALIAQGFKLTQTSEWTADAERGSKGASIMLGAFAGKSGRHVKINVSCTADPSGNLVITLRQGTSGMSGGLIGAKQARDIYDEVYRLVEQTFQSAGVLAATGNV